MRVAAIVVRNVVWGGRTRAGTLYKWMDIFGEG